MADEAIQVLGGMGYMRVSGWIMLIIKSNSQKREGN